MNKDSNQKTSSFIATIGMNLGFQYKLKKEDK